MAMQIDGGNVPGLFNRLTPGSPTPSRQPHHPAEVSAPPLDASSSDNIPAKTIPAPQTQNNIGSLFYGNVSLDLYASRSESLTTQYTSQGPDGYQSFRQELGRRFESSLSLDFSFLARVDGAAEKLAALDGSILDKWMAEASDLLGLDEKDFEEFVVATDELFNEIEKALGMGPEGLDHIADFFTEEVDRFLDGVKENVEYFEENPLGEGDDLGLGIPGLKKAIAQNIPNDFKDFVERMLERLNDDEIAARLGPLMEFYEELLERLSERRHEVDDDHGEGHEKNENEHDDGDDGHHPDSQRFVSESYRYYYESVTQISASFQYLAQDGSSGGNENQQPVDVTA